MREVAVTNIYKVYPFEELTDEAKEKAKQWYLDGQNELIFSEMVIDDLYSNYGFKNSALEIEYSLGYCQGDGLNIWGTVYLKEVLEQVKEYFDDAEYGWLNLKFESFTNTFDMPSNGRYTYCICDRHDYMEDFVDDFLNLYEEDELPMHIVDKFNKECQIYFTKLCKKYEEWGYNYFYEIDDADLAEICAMNEYEFLEDGTLFC